MFIGCPPGIRTPISRSRICCPTIERGGNSRRETLAVILLACGVVVNIDGDLHEPACYSLRFTLTTVILENPSSNVGGFSFALMRRITSSATVRARL